MSGFSIINLDVTTSWILTTYSKFNEDSVYLRAWKFTSSGLESPVDTLIYTTDSAGVATTYYSYSVLTFRGGPHSRLAIAAHANYVNNIGENTALVEGTFNINTGEYIFQTLHSNFATNRSNVVSRGRTVSSELDTIQDLLYSKNANVLYAIYGKYNKNGITPYNGAENTDTNKNRIYIYNIGSSSVRTPSRTELSSNLPGIPIALIPLGYNTDSFNVALGFTHQNNLNLSTPNTENFKIVTISNSDIFASANIDKDTSTFHTVFVVNATRNEDEVFDIIGTGGVKNPVSGNPDGSGTGVVGVEIEEDEDEDVFGCMIPGSANFCATCTTPFEWYILGPDGQQFSANPTIMLGYFDSPDYEVLMLHNHNGDCITWSCDSVGMAYQDEACGFCWETEQEAEQASGQGVDACTFCTDENADNYAWDEYLLCTNEQWFPLNVQQSDLVNQGTGGSVSLSSAVDGSYATLCLESIAFYEASSSWQLENPNDPNLPYTTETLSHCQYTIGCMDAGACNYNPNATIPADDVPWWHQFFEGDSVTDTGDCTYPVPACNCDGSFDVNTSGAIGSTQIDEGGVNMSGSTYCDCANGSPVATPPWFGTNGNFGQLRNTLIYPGASTSIFTNYYGSSYASANEEQEAQLLELCGCGGSVPHTSVGGKPLSDFTDNSLAGPDGVFITNSRRACRCDGTIAQDLFIVNQVELLKGIHGHLATAAVNTKEGRYCDCDGNTTAAGSDNNGCPNNCLYSINASVCGCPYDVPQTQPDGTSQVYYRLPDNYNTTDPTQPMYCNCENGSPTLANIAYDDSDGDLLGNPNMPIYYCGDTPPTGYVTNNGDENPATACDAQEAETYPGGFDADANLENSSFVLPQVGFPVATMPDQLEVIGDIHNGERVFRTWWTTHAAPVGLGTDGVSYQDYFGICAGGVMRGVCGGVLNFINQPTYQDNSGNWRWETRGDYRNDWWLKDSKMQTQGEHQGCCEDTFKGGDGLCYSSQEELPVQACDGSWVPPQFEEASQATACGHCTMVKSSYGSGYGGYNQWGGASNITDAYNSANDEEMYGDCRHNCATLEEMQVNNPSICRCDILTPRPGFPESTTLRYLDECDVCNGTNLCTREGCTEVGAVNLHICFDPVAQLPWELSPNPTPPEALVGSMNCEGVTIINNYGCVFPGEINMEQISSEQIEKTLSNVLFIDPTSESFFNLPVIWNNPTFENSYFGEFGEITITTDNPYYTTKCQVIHRGDPQLILSSPATLAENLYTHENNVVDNSGNEYEGENLVGFDNEIYLESQGFSGDFGVTRWYYFRVKGYLEDTENGVRFATADNLLFNGDGSSINFDEVVARTGFNTQNNITALNLQIVDPLGNKVLPYTYDNVNVPSHSTSYSSINQIGDLKTGVANLALEDFENSTYAKPLYYVYAVRSNNDDSHIIDFSSLFYTEYYGCTDPNACNYDDSANTDDGSCFYEGATDTYGNFIDCAGQQVGCTDPNAKNYNANATIDSGHCVYYQQETYQVCLNPQATEYTYWCTNPDNPNYPNGCDDQGTPFPYIDDTLNVWTTYVEGDSCTLCELPECLDCVTEQYNENIPKCCDPTALNYFGGNLTSCDYCVESSLANPRFPCEYGSVLFENQFLNQECTNCIIYEIQTSSPNFTFTQEILNDFRYIIYDSAGRVVYSSEDSVTHLLEQASPNPFGIASASTNQELITYAAGGTLSESIRRMIDISSLPMGCYTFLPLGFTKNEVWKHTKLTIKLNGQIKHSLISGGSSSSNALGVMGLNIGYGDCVPGCGNSPLEFNPPTCENIAIIDEDGIIEMKLAVQLAQVEQDDAYNRVIVQVINVQTGKVLAQVGGLNSDGVTYQSLIPGATYAESFILTEPETIGVKVVNNSNIMYPIDYSIVANNNKTIISKRSI